MDKPHRGQHVARVRHQADDVCSCPPPGTSTPTRFRLSAQPSRAAATRRSEHRRRRPQCADNRLRRRCSTTTCSTTRSRSTSRRGLATHRRRSTHLCTYRPPTSQGLTYVDALAVMCRANGCLVRVGDRLQVDGPGLPALHVPPGFTYFVRRPSTAAARPTRLALGVSALEDPVPDLGKRLAGPLFVATHGRTSPHW